MLKNVIPHNLDLHRQLKSVYKSQSFSQRQIL